MAEHPPSHPWHRALARLPGARWIDENGLVAIASGHEYAGFNVVLAADGAAAIDRAAAMMATGAWTRHSPGPIPDRLDDLLLARGYHPRTLDLVTAELAALHLPAQPDVSALHHPDDIAGCSDMIAEVFAVPEAQRPEFHRVYAALATGPAPPWQLFGLRQWGTVIAACVLATADDHVEIHAAVTSPVARGHGLAARVVTEALRRARAAGGRTIVADTEPGGTVMARRLGLRRAGVLRQLARVTHR